MSAQLNSVVKQIDTNLQASIERLKDLLRIQSISTSPAYKQQTQQAADFMAQQLQEIGFDASARPTAGHPMVVAHYRAPGGEARPTILYYGHYDVQPPEPLELWTSPPFEPTIVNGEHGKRIVARGAVDDKGQLMTFVEAFRAWMQVHGELPINVIVMLEGEEESGSPSLNPFLETNRDELQADVCVVCDTGMWDIDTPAVTYMLRGLVYAEVTLHGPAMDLHSGMYGGAVVNPNNALASILAQLHDDDRIVQIPHFYDDVRELSKEESAQWKSLGFDEAKFLSGAGLTHPTGEKGRSTLERTWSRPTCDVNGMWGGYIGDGAKTVIPSHASAKVSCRLVADQDPQQVFDNLKKFFEQRTPPDCKWTFKSHGISPPIRVPTESPYLEATMRGLSTVYNRKPVLIGSGGSIPVVSSIRSILGFDSLLVGFGLDDDRVHSPNEKFELRCYEMGIKSHAAIMEQLSMIEATSAATR